jgi:hypothetical protein
MAKLVVAGLLVLMVVAKKAASRMWLRDENTVAYWWQLHRMT